jgi:hypothetical protein
MKFTMACSTWVKEKDELVLAILQEARTMPTVAQLAEKIGLPPWRVEQTLRMWRKQIVMAASRKRLPDWV